MERLFNFSLIFQMAAEFLPLVFLFFLKKQINKSLKIFLISSFISSFLLYLTGVFQINNLIIFNAYQGITICTLSIFYFSILKSHLFKIIIVIIFSICFFTLIWELTKTSYLVSTLVVESFCYIIFALLFYIDYINSSKVNNQAKSYILINTSIFIYNCFSVLNNLEIEKLMITNYWFIHNLIDGLLKLLIAIAIWKMPKTYLS